MKTTAHKATFLALSTAGISGVSLFINKFAVSSVSDPVLFSGLKNTLVALLLVGVLLAFNKHKEIKTLTKKQWSQLVSICLVGGAIPFALFFTGLSMIPATQGALIHKTLFIWVALLAALFLQEKLSLVQWLGVSALFGANVVLADISGFALNGGVILVFIATLFWAFENVLAKKALENLSAITVASGRMVFGSLFLLSFLTVTGRISGLANLTPESLMWTSVTVIFLLGYLLTWYKALSLAPASYVAALLVPATLVTNVLSALFVTHTLTEAQVLSGFLTVLGVSFVVLFVRTKTQNLQPTQSALHIENK